MLAVLFGGPCKVEEVCPLGVVEVEGSGQRLQDALGDPSQAAAFESGVVLDADTGQECNLFSP